MDTAHLGSDEEKRYKKRYCGICRGLTETMGLKGTLCLQYDLVLLSLVLSSMYEPEEDEILHRCVKHAIKGREVLCDDTVRYAADMGMMLSYLKAEDDSKDEKGIRGNVAVHLLKDGFLEAEKRHPVKCVRTKEILDEMSALEEDGCKDIDTMCAAFGRLMGNIFVYKEEDFFAGYLFSFGDALGRYLYLLDACLDFDDDRKKGRYNPLHGTEHEDIAWQRRALSVLLGEVAASYEMLPLVKDKKLLDNIIYSGITDALPAELKENAEEDRGK